METLIPLNGTTYTFETDLEKKRTELKLRVQSTPSQHKQPKAQTVPAAWLVTTSNGIPLFALKPRPEDQIFRVLTARQLYATRAQWFEPLADNYRVLIWNNPESATAETTVHAAYKHFTWKQIIEFAKVDRPSISFYSGNAGDWKQASYGGAGYLLVLVDGQPYWADAIGQTPFAVDTFKKYFAQYENKGKAIRKTVETGIGWGDGTLFGSSDPCNEYDNYMVLRGTLWASENHSLASDEITVPGADYPITQSISRTVFTPTGDSRMKSPIDPVSASTYGVWKQRK
jgi:hypothetical protein